MKAQRVQLKIDESFSPMSELPAWLDFIKENFKFYGKPKHDEKWLNVPCSFDIETTNFYSEDGQKRACMYIWMVSIFGKAFYGRTWYEFQTFCDTVSEKLELNENRRIVFYVHNLSYEFGFLQWLFPWEKVFATDVHKVIYAYTITGIEFRCSLILYGASLDHLGKKGLTRYEVKKATGDLDYSLLRHSETPLTDVEMNYCLQDVQVVVAYIEEKIQDDKRLCFVPLTKTGFPRRLVKKRMLYGKGSWDNRKLLEKLTYELDEFWLTRWMYAGGFTHTAHAKVGKVWYDVASQDFTSDYPFCLLMPIYPISKGEKIVIRDMEHFKRNLQNFCCLFHVRFKNIRETFGYEHILSLSKCKNVVDPVSDNGRIVRCKSCECALNELDYEMMQQYYEWDDMEIMEFYRYNRGYLPKQFIETVIELFWKKQVYKYEPDMRVEFMQAKSDLNALYGVCVTNPLQNSISFTRETGWKKDPQDYQTELDKYNAKKSRFIFYGWGCWCTSYARMRLQRTILQLKEDYIYSDTDSVKYLHKEKNDWIFEECNRQVEKDLQRVCDFYHIDFSQVCPDGKMLGVFDYEGNYRRMKSMGAKRYMTQNQKTGEISMTVAGLNKKTAVPWMLINYEDPFAAFDDTLHVPEGFAGKLTHTYSDEGFTEFLTDYLGNTAVVSEQSFVHLEEAPYSLNIAKEFDEYLKGLIQ